jgi:hypothetical protein
MPTPATLLFVLSLVSLIGPAQIGRAWTWDDRIAEADLVVVAQVVESRDTGRKSSHPSLTSFPMVEMETEFRVLGVLKGALGGNVAGRTAADRRIVLHHYRPDFEQWRRDHPGEPGQPPPGGIVNLGTALQFETGAGPYTLFLVRTARGWEPLSGHTFPTASVFGMVEGRLPPPAPAETYESVQIDTEGRLAIVATSGRRAAVRKRGEQTAFGAPAISADRTAVAAQALFANCCSSYDIPLALVVYARGVEHRFTGNGLPIFQWGFPDGGERVAYGQETVHGSCVTHYELRDIRSERLIDTVDVPKACGQAPNPQPVVLPDWVKRLVAGLDTP